MGNLQSKSLDTEIDDEDEEENAISPQNRSDFISLHQSEFPRRETRSYQTKHQTISVPDLRGSSSIAPTNVDDNVKNSAAFVNEISPPPNQRRRRRRKEVPETVKCRAAAAEDRRIKHYSSGHRILLVGEGDFSFSTCLASAFGVASNMVATSLDSHGFLVKNYRSALSNLVELSIRKCRVIHDVNATEMATHDLLAGIKFDRIVFNFPFAGFFKDIPRDDQLWFHRRLVSMFMENAKEMLSENGEIHITHKTNGFHKEWKVELLATLHRLRLVEEVEFNKVDYPGYNTKRGFGGDKNFDCNPSITYKFRL